MIRKFLKYAFVVLVGWPVIFVWLQVRVHARERLPARGPAIIVANHNSHLDTVALLVLFPLRQLASLRPVAAADYFMSSRLLAWFARRAIDVIPVERGGHVEGDDPLHACHDALAHGEILIIFPEGTRGAPEQMGEFRSGVAYLAERHPGVPVIPVFMHGFGIAMPRGAALPVPGAADIHVGAPLQFNSTREAFMAALRGAFDDLRAGWLARRMPKAMEGARSCRP